MAVKEVRVYSVPKEEGTVKFSVVGVVTDFGPHRFATYCRDDAYNQADANGGYFWGHYFETAALADADFIRRCALYPGGYISIGKSL